ncbi:hypothetical protein MK338_01935, partial [Streptococcus vestibularis]
IVYR